MFLKVIACEIGFREISTAAAQSTNLVELEFLPQGHHEAPEHAAETIQERIDMVPPHRFDAILIGYGLCNEALKGLTTHHTPLVIPRVHDCIALFLGSRQRYVDYCRAHPGTYFFTAGWLEHRDRRADRLLCSQSWGCRPQRAFAELAESYGPDAALSMVVARHEWPIRYTHGCLIRFDFIPSVHMAEEARAICDCNGWTYDEVDGDLHLLRRGLDGLWNDDEFITVSPGLELILTYGDRLMEPCVLMAQALRA